MFITFLVICDLQYNLHHVGLKGRDVFDASFMGHDINGSNECLRTGVRIASSVEQW